MEPPPSGSSNSAMSSSVRFQRNMKERDRRRQMKELLAQLSSTIYPQTTPKLSVPELVDEATDYVNKLHERIQKLKQQKALYETTSNAPINDDEQQDQETTSNTIQGRSRVPGIDIKNWDSELEVNFICGSDKKFVVHDVIRVLQDEAAEVTNLTYHNVENNNVIYIIKAQASEERLHLGIPLNLSTSVAIIPRIGIETSSIHQRLKELIY